MALRVGERVITSEEEVDPGWLTGALRGSGALLAGRVVSFESEGSDASWSTHLRVRPKYAADAEGECPPALFLKICAGERAVFGPSEIHYYTRDYRDCEGAPLPRCYDAAYRHEPRAYHLLLEDLTETHRSGFERPPTERIGLGAADALARLHAHYWGSARLARLGARVAGEDEVARYFAYIEPGLRPMFDALGGDLSPQWRDVLLEVFAEHPGAMVRRGGDDAGFTLVHGDANPGNILVPRRGTGSFYLIDRQPFDWSLQVWLGVSDLALMMVLYWDEEHRRRWQLPILRRYHRGLAAHGLDYSWERLGWDYRLCAVQGLEFAVEWCVLPEDRAEKRWLWERQLRRAMDAYLELDCGDLWGSEPPR